MSKSNYETEFTVNQKMDVLLNVYGHLVAAGFTNLAVKVNDEILKLSGKSK